MGRELLRGTGYRAPRGIAVEGARRLFHSGENIVVALALAAMAILPIAEILLRGAFKFGIPGNSSIVQHLTLVVAMLGAAVAAREGRLLSLSTGAAFLPGGLQRAARLFSGAFGATVTIFLGIASWRFLLTEREGGGSIRSFDHTFPATRPGVIVA